jgi:hypothetical protein
VVTRVPPPRTRKKKENPYITEENELMIQDLDKLLKEKGPMRAVDIRKHMEFKSWNVAKGFLTLATNYIPIWEENGWYGVLGGDDDSV